MAAPHFRQLFQRNFQSFLRYFPLPVFSLVLFRSLSSSCSCPSAASPFPFFSFFKRGLRRNASRTDAECITMLYAKRALFLLFLVLPITTYFVGSHGSFSLNVSSLLRHFMNPRFRLLEHLFISRVIFQFTTHLFVQ